MKACRTGKRAYGSAQAARRAHAHARFRVRVYVCEWCGQLHVTHEAIDREDGKPAGWRRG